MNTQLLESIKLIGLLHGGASVLLAETLGSSAGMLCVGEGEGCVGIESNANHLRGVRELCLGFLWETDTGKGVSYPEVADGMPEVLNAQYTQFRIKIRKDLKWSDGVGLTTEDIIYTFETYSKEAKRLTDGQIPVINRYSTVKLVILGMAISASSLVVMAV